MGSDPIVLDEAGVRLDAALATDCERLARMLRRPRRSRDEQEALRLCARAILRTIAMSGSF